MPIAPWEVLHLFALHFIETLAYAAKNNAVADLSLVVALWIVRGGESVGDLILGTKASYLSAREVGPLSKMMA